MVATSNNNNYYNNYNSKNTRQQEHEALSAAPLKQYAFRCLETVESDWNWDSLTKLQEGQQQKMWQHQSLQLNEYRQLLN